MTRPLEDTLKELYQRGFGPLNPTEFELEVEPKHFDPDCESLRLNRKYDGEFLLSVEPEIAIREDHLFAQFANEEDMVLFRLKVMV